MPSDQHDNLRFSPGPVVRVAAGLIVAAIVAIVITIVVTGGNGLAVGLLVALAFAGLTGLILERIDSTRRRKPGSERRRGEHWGFHGRPGR